MRAWSGLSISIPREAQDLFKAAMGSSSGWIDCFMGVVPPRLHLTYSHSFEHGAAKGGQWLKDWRVEANQ